MLRPLHQLAVLNAAELGERPVRRLIAPDALRGREHRVAAVAFLVVAVVLVAVDDDLVADLPPLDLGPDRPNDARGVGPGDVIRVLVHVEHGNRLAERRPNPVVVDARRHHQNEDVVAVEGPGRHDLDLHRLFRRPVPFLAHDPRVHRLRHMAERGDFADLVEILDRSFGRQVLGGRTCVHGHPREGGVWRPDADRAAAMINALPLRAGKSIRLFVACGASRSPGRRLRFAQCLSALRSSRSASPAEAGDRAVLDLA